MNKQNQGINPHAEERKVIKRNGEEVAFDISKIQQAISRANDEMERESDRLTRGQIYHISGDIEALADSVGRALTIEEIQNAVEEGIMQMQKYALARCYIKYRHTRELNRKSNTTDESILSLIECQNEEVKQENSNKNPTIASVQRDYMAGEVSKDLTNRILLPSDIVEAHKSGKIHFHDADYFAQHIHNCDLINLEDMLQNGTCISGTWIDKPTTFSVACNIATQIIAQVASSQYGGQSISLSHLAPFIDSSRQKFRKEVAEEHKMIGVELTTDQINAIAEERVKKDVEKGIQTIQYQVVTLMTTNGQAPFITVFMYIDEVPEGQLRDDLAMAIKELLKQRILGVKNEQGTYVSPSFPKIIYVLDEDNIEEGTKYWDVTQLAAECTAKRMVPDYISAKVMRELKDNNVYTCMGCRSFLTVDRFSNKVGNISNARNFEQHKGHVYYGRFNQGVVTINLVDVACSSEGNYDKFWSILDERLALCHKALRLRHERLKGTKSDIAPILWQYGALARLKKGETIDKLLYDGYSTISLGYAGLYECVKYMTGKSHRDPSATPFGLSVMQKLNDACANWKAAENIDYSVYGTPLESTTYKFAKCLQERFGIIEGVTDRTYITNSYHVHVTEKINAFDKLTFESQFQKLSPGGAISYVEVPDMSHNIPAVLGVMKHIYNTIMYAELNTKLDYCGKCGYEGEAQLIKIGGKYQFKCPRCGNMNTGHDEISDPFPEGLELVDENGLLYCSRRTCGYMGNSINGWNQGRLGDIHDRELHL